MIGPEELNEEIFCIGYEARTFAGYINYGRIERWIPGFTDYVTEDSHIKRYALACKYTENKSVLDIASGSGRGTWMIAAEGNATSVLGVDIDNDALRYANHRNKHERIKFEQGDATTFVQENAFDVIVSFETVEHLQETAGYFTGINKSLKKEGLFFISTPIAAQHLNNKPDSIYHIREWGYHSFQQEVEKYMNIKDVYLQLYPLFDKSFITRIKKKIMRTLGIKYAAQEVFSVIYKASELPSGIKTSKLGKMYKGYQILVCTKNIAV